MTKKRRRKGQKSWSMSRQSGSTSRQSEPTPRPKVVQIVTYEITDEPILDRQYKRLPREVKGAIERLHDLSQVSPRQAIPELVELIEKYPNVPQLYNYLSVAYSRAGQVEKSEEVIQENLRRNPDYLFARVNYGEICLARGDYEAIAELFDHKFDLKLLYPKRNKFHVSEVMGLMGLAGMYFVGTGQREVAEKYYDILTQIDPKHPFTRRLRRALFPGFFRRLFRKAK